MRSAVIRLVSGLRDSISAKGGHIEINRPDVLRHGIGSCCLSGADARDYKLVDCLA